MKTKDQITEELSDYLVEYLQIADLEDLIEQGKFMIEQCKNPKCDFCLKIKSLIDEGARVER